MNPQNAIEKLAAKTQVARSGRTMKLDRAFQELSVAGDPGQSGKGVFRYPTGSKVAALRRISYLLFRE